MSTNFQRTLCAGAALLSLLLVGAAPQAVRAGEVPAGVAPAAPAAPAAYILSPDDQLAISVLGHQDLTDSLVILPDGTFHFPIVGNVPAAGKTVDQLTRFLERGLSSQLNTPEVTVTVVQSRPRKVSVLGAVRAPGQYDSRLGTHLLDTLAAAGGPAQAPELTQMTLVTDGGTKTQSIDVVKLMDGSDPDLNVLLQPGDVLLLSPRDPAVADVQVMGEVGRPGIFTVPVGGATVSSMLTEAGGTTPRAALSRVQIMHGGKINTVDLRPSQSSLSDPAGEQHLVAGDVLLVPDTGAKVGLLGEFRAPGPYDYPDRNGLTLLTALPIAGGLTTDADRSKAIILRSGPDGKPVVIPVNLDAVLKGDPTAAATPLQPGDLLYVPPRHHAQGFNPLSFLLPYAGYLAPRL